MKKRMVMLLIFSTITNIYLVAQTWNGSVSNDWNTAGNWTPGNVPISSGNVIINNAAATHQPALAGSVNIASLTMSAGILNLNSFTITCSGNAIFTGDSVRNGKVIANTFNNIANMHIGGKFILEKTGSSNGAWNGNNRFYGDSLIITWRLGTLYLENAASSPDSIFGNLKVLLADNYSVGFAISSQLYVQKDLILNNTGNGTFLINSLNAKLIAGNMVGQNFTRATPDLPLQNITTLGNNANGPFYSHNASINNCNFNGNFTLVADSNVSIPVHNSVFSGADNLLQAGNFDAYGNDFGKTGSGTTILRAAHNPNATIYIRTGNNKFIGNAQWETYAASSGTTYIQNNWYGPDSCLQDLTFILKGNSVLTTNGNGHNYVAGNVIIDGQGARKWIEFTGGAGNDFNIGGSFIAKNFSASPEPGVIVTKVILHNITAAGTDTCGTFYCYTGDISYCSFNGNFKLIADSSQSYFINNSSFQGIDNLFQAGITETQINRFGLVGSGTTILRSVLNSGSNYMRDGNNKFFNNAQWETYAAYPNNVTIQQNFFGVDSCWGNMNFILMGNSTLTTNRSGYNYVAGNLTIDGQGARKGVLFTGGAGRSFTVGGNFTVKNFTPNSLPSVGTTTVNLRNLYVNGADTCGTFYCYTGDITNSSFNGNLKIIADSSQPYYLNNSFFLGADNLFQGGNLDVQNSKFGQTGNGTTILKVAHNLSTDVVMRDGNNKFLGNAQWETYAVYPGSLTIQQTFFGADTCLGNMNYILKGNAALTTNISGHSYVAGNVTIDGQGARKWVQFNDRIGISFNVAGNFTAKNFAPRYEPGVTSTNVYLHNLNVAGTDTMGTFYCYTGDIINSSFNGNFKLIADSSQGYNINNSSLLGADNLFQAGNLDVQNSKFGQTGNGTTILKVAHNLSTDVWMRDGNNKFLGNAEWNAIAPSAGSILIQQTFYGADTCLGNLAVNLVGASRANLAGNNLYIGKGLSLQNNGIGVIVHDNGASAIYFIGNDTASYSYGGSGSAPSLRNVGINREGGLRLLSPLSCSGLVLTRGVILSSSVNPLQMPNVSVVVGGGDSSYIDGPMIKTGNTVFTFPLGKNNVYAPIGITAPVLSTDVFRAQYFNINPGIVYDSTQHDASLNHISRSEYWLLDRTSGTATPKVTLSWSANRSGPVDVMNNLRIARWDGSAWKDEGNGNTSGTNEEGTIQSLNNISNFSPFTIASSSVNNALPVTFLLFNVTPLVNHTILLQWKTAVEINNANYEVERSTDGRKWIKIATVLPVPLHEYDYTDNAVAAGLYYYRIKQVDTDGSYNYSIIRVIKLMGDTRLSIWPNPVTNILFVQSNFTKGSLEITDVNGKIVRKDLINNTLTTIPVQHLAKGVYTIRIYYNEGTLVEKFIKQ